MSESNERIWQKRFERERLIRKEAEALMEQKTLELYEINQKLQTTAEELRQNNEELAAMVEFMNQQRKTINQKSEDIAKSIEAAFRIQNAISPSENELLHLFKAHFLLNIPRDTVSGDFLWVQEQNGLKIVVVADCTGHGVPGALMSVVGNALLNKVVTDKQVQEPADILYWMNVYLKTFFQKSEVTIYEGMDAAVCVYVPNSRVLKYAGAHMSLYYTQNGDFFEIKATKNSLGGGGKNQDTEYNYSQHELKLEKDSFFYLCSDGFQDQFGGPNDKRFLKKNLRNLLHTIHNQTAEYKKTSLSQAFHDWKGDNPQIDDLLLLGFEF
ncbi:MAG: hypothetical protein EAZ57_09935 [Cytophagales bacterium]|nr:MAG: hypothetical protein EAZ67_10535 [Cytophagales bacterium]TAF59762.1 MAG: hypothetical protein EAZ57_09935 [Cytophagales bacterium]